MQGKTKGFFEDTAIILVFTGTIYGAYYLYNNTSNDSVILSESVQLEKKDLNIELSEEKSFFDKNFILLKNMFTDLFPLFKDQEKDEMIPIIVKRVKETPIIEEKVSLIKNDIEALKISEQRTPLLVSKMEKNQIKKEKTDSIVENEEVEITVKETPPILKYTEKVKIVELNDGKNKKNVDKSDLRVFLRQLKFDIASNIDKSDAQNSDESQKLKIRITVLKDGNYERLHFVDGNKKLFDKNKENILKVFPLNISDSIVSEFPRYVRISIK